MERDYSLFYIHGHHSLPTVAILMYNFLFPNPLLLFELYSRTSVSQGSKFKNVNLMYREDDKLKTPLRRRTIVVIIIATILIIVIIIIRSKANTLNRNKRNSHPLV